MMEHVVGVDRYSSGALVRLATCKSFTDCLPKLISLITLFAPETAG